MNFRFGLSGGLFGGGALFGCQQVERLPLRVQGIERRLFTFMAFKRGNGQRAVDFRAGHQLQQISAIGRTRLEESIEVPLRQ